MTAELAFSAPVDPLTLAEPVVSSTVRAVAYDAGRQVLRVQFQSGCHYEYFGVPTWLYDAFFEAQPHPWTLLGREVRRYPFRRGASDRPQANAS